MTQPSVALKSRASSPRSVPASLRRENSTAMRASLTGWRRIATPWQWPGGCSGSIPRRAFAAGFRSPGRRMADGATDWLQAAGSAAAAGAAGIVTALIGYLTGRGVNKETARKIAAEADKLGAETDRAETDAEAALVAALNERIGLLIKGYEQRIEDLTNEVHSLRAEIVSLRKALDERP